MITGIFRFTQERMQSEAFRRKRVEAQLAPEGGQSLRFGFFMDSMYFNTDCNSLNDICSNAFSIFVRSLLDTILSIAFVSTMPGHGSRLTASL